MAQIWLIAAPPDAKLSSIWRLTADGYADTPRAATPWLAANTHTNGRSTEGCALPCQAASHSANSSKRPRLRAGLVRLWSRRRTAATASKSGPGMVAIRRRMSSKGWPSAAAVMGENSSNVSEVRSIASAAGAVKAAEVR